MTEARSRNASPNGCDATQVPRRRVRTRQMVVLGGVALFTFIAIALGLGTRLPLFRASGPKHATNEAPGIGFDLTPSYGTVAIRHDNGSFENVAQVPWKDSADYPGGLAGYPETYRHMMKRLSEHQYFYDPYAYYCHDGLLPSRRTLWKRARRLVGLPSDDDVGRLIDAIRELKLKTEDHLGYSIKDVMVTSAPFAQLCRDDLTEAVEYLGLTHLVETHNGWPDQGQPREESTAYAGYGLGICEHPKEPERCKAEEHALPKKNTLSIFHTGSELTTFYWSMSKAAPQSYGVSRPYRVTWDLAAPENRHWDLMKLKLLAPVSDWGYPGRNHVDRVVLVGSEAGSEAMLLAVREAMMELQGDVPEIYQGNTLYVAAKGAAEFAKRALDAAVIDGRKKYKHGAL